MEINENAPTAELRAIDGDLTKEGLTGILESHRNALQDVRGDTQRLSERIERMIPEMQTALSDAKTQNSVEIIPTGDESLQDARYLLPDGTVQFRSTEQEINIPGGGHHSIRRPGFLNDPNPITPAQKRAQDAYAGYALAFKRAQLNGCRNPVAEDAIARKGYANLRAALMEIGGGVGRYCRAIYNDPNLMQRAVTKTAGSGGELIDNPTIADVRRSADLARRVPGLVKTVDVVSSTFKRASITGRGLAAARAVPTDSPSAYTPRTPTTSDGSLVLKDQEIVALVDPMFLQDSGNVLGQDVMGEILNWLESGYMDSLEIAFLHGDTAGTHMDTLSTWTVGGLYTAGALDTAASPAKFWIGFRGRAVDDSNTASAGGGFDVAEWFSSIGLLGNQAGGGVVAITGLDCLYSQLLGSASFTTVDVMGARATLLTGEIGAIGGTPVIISEMMPKQFNTASGIYDGSALGNEIVFAAAGNYTHYQMASNGDFSVERPERGASYIGLIRRTLLDFDGVAGDKPCSILYNL